MGKRDHLVPEVIQNVNGVVTTVHKNPRSKVTTKNTGALIAPKSAVQTATFETEDEAVTDEPERLFKPNPEWGAAHLNRRNFRIARGLRELDPDVQRDVTRRLSSDSENSTKDYVAAIGVSLKKWEEIANVGSAPVIETAESTYTSSRERYGMLTSMSRNERVIGTLVAEINRNRADDDPDVESEDVRATVRLIRDATSTRDAAFQTRAYAIRNRRQDLQEQMGDLQRQIDEAEAPLRALSQDDKYTYNLGGDDGEANIDFQPRRSFQESLARADLNKKEMALITVSKPDWSLLKDVVGADRYESYRTQGTTAVTIR